MRYIFIKLFIAVVLLSFILTCQNQKAKTVSFAEINGNRILTCNIDKIHETRELMLSEIVDSVSFVKLSSNINALIGNTWLEQYSADHILLVELNNKLSLFDSKGNFVKSWSSGKAPTEFILPDQPQYLNGNVYVKDKYRNRLLKLNEEGIATESINLAKVSGASILLNDSVVLCFGNSETNNDPYLVCEQDIQGNVTKSINAKYQVALNPPIAGESVICYPYGDGWNVHFPGNDTLMFYSNKLNTLTPKAIFYSQSHLEINRLLYQLRKSNGLAVDDQRLTRTIKVVPEFESEQYYFLSVYFYGIRKDLPWYAPERKVCLVDKKTQEAFYAKFINDFLGNTPFEPLGNRPFWSKNIIHVSSAITVKKNFGELLMNKNVSLNQNVTARISSVISNLAKSDNSLVFLYVLK
jgi:hypothetical protein